MEKALLSKTGNKNEHALLLFHYCEIVLLSGQENVQSMMSIHSSIPYCTVVPIFFSYMQEKCSGIINPLLNGFAYYVWTL